MSSLFVYGTLRHIPLLEIVLGRVASKIEFQQDVLHHHQVMAANEGPFPLIIKGTGQVDGLLLENLTPADLERLNFYEGGFGYTRALLQTQNGHLAEVYFPPEHGVTSQKKWDLDEWADQWGDLTCIAAREAMSLMGQVTPKKLATMFPMLRARAGAVLNAQEPKQDASTFSGRVEISQQKREYTDFFALNSYQLQHERFDGGMTQTMDRAVFLGTDAAILLPYDPKRDRVLLIEQFRMGPLGRQDTALWQKEPIAGRVDGGEDPQACAIREAKEEANLDILHVEKVCQAYASPGCSTEYFYCYVGLCDLPDDVTGVFGLHTENEDIRSHLMSFEALMAFVQSGQGANVPLNTISFWLALHRDRLRAMP